MGTIPTKLENDIDEFNRKEWERGQKERDRKRQEEERVLELIQESDDYKKFLEKYEENTKNYDFNTPPKLEKHFDFQCFEKWRKVQYMSEKTISRIFETNFQEKFQKALENGYEGFVWFELQGTEQFHNSIPKLREKFWVICDIKCREANMLLIPEGTWWQNIPHLKMVTRERNGKTQYIVSLGIQFLSANPFFRWIINTKKDDPFQYTDYLPLGLP